jgi:hypothetical protein
MNKRRNALVVGDMAWADSLPEWLLEEIRQERMILGLAALGNPEIDKVGDAEVTAYLMTASMRAPLTSEYTTIYCSLSAKLMAARGKELDLEMRQFLEKGLTEWEQHELKELKSMIYEQRGGEIVHPVLNLMRAFKSECDKRGKEKQPRLL